MREAAQSRVDELDDAGHQPVDLTVVRPYKSATVLRFDVEDLGAVVAAVRRFARGLPSGSDRQYEIIGVDWTDSRGDSFDAVTDFDTLDVVVCRNISPPPWSTKDSPLDDVRHLLNIALFRRGLVALHLADPWKAGVQSWLDGPSRPPGRRIPANALLSACLGGAARGLWRRGPQPRRSSRPDAKNLTGLRLQNALNPIEDSGYAMGAGRAEFTADGSTALKGMVGTTPRKSTVWSGRARSFSDFGSFCRGLLDEVQNVLDIEDTLESVFPELAEEISSLDGVNGAYEVLFTWPEGPPGEALEPDEQEAVDLLSSTEFVLCGRGREDGPHFGLDVMTPDAQKPFRADVEVRAVDSGFDLDCVIDRPGRHRSTGILRECFKDPDRISVYYESGHTITAGRLYRFEVRPSRFKNWSFEDFTGFDVASEKPPGSGQAMDAAIGVADDVSLFSWVVDKFCSGFLTCDDGAGEVADFVHVSPDVDRLALIHVKAASSNRPTRAVSAQAYEVVAGQAVKNLMFLNRHALRERLARPAGRLRASWVDGARVDSRETVLEALDALKPVADAVVHIVQPHLQKHVYEKTRREQSSESLRLRLLETLLNTARSSAVALSADLRVIGDGSAAAPV